MDTTCVDIGNTIMLNCSSKNISDLTGIQFFKHLLVFWCSNNSLTFLPSISNFLIQLDCHNNQLSTLPILPSSLLHLYCYDNQLSTLPLLPASLQVLNCGNNPLHTLLNPLPHSLESLSCNGNQLAILPSLPLTLKNLSCGDNQLIDLPILSDSLITLSCNFNMLAVLPNLPNSITILTCSHNEIDVLPTLPNSLTKLICDNNNLNCLPNLPNTISTLWCSDNQIDSLPSLPSSLIYLICRNNNLLNLPLLPDSLFYLNCSGNHLTYLPNLPHTLSYLFGSNNQLTYLPELPDTMNSIYVDGNAQLLCMPLLNFYDGNWAGFRISGTGIKCLPNLIQHLGSVPAIDTMPICSYSTLINQVLCSNQTYNFNGIILNTSGIYVDTFNTSDGCNSIVSLHLSFEAININISQSTDSLTANATTAIYQWLNCNNGFAIINGATNQTFVATANGNYAVAITQNGCTDTSACYSISGVGVSELAVGSMQLTVFPNPATEQLTIQLLRQAQYESYEISITDIFGREIYQSKNNLYSQIINLNSFSSGIYFLKVISPNGNSTVNKFVKE